MFGKKAPNLEEVRTQLLALIASAITQYNQQVQANPSLKKPALTSHVDMIPNEQLSARVGQILTPDVIDFMDKDQSGVAFQAMLSPQVLQAISLAYIDFYFFTLIVTAETRNKQQLQIGIRTIASTFHIARATEHIKQQMFLETITEVNDALDRTHVTTPQPKSTSPNTCGILQQSENKEMQHARQSTQSRIEVDHCSSTGQWREATGASVSRT